MKSVVVIINDAPYGNERAYNGLRYAQAVLVGFRPQSLIRPDGLHVNVPRPAAVVGRSLDSLLHWLPRTVGAFTVIRHQTFVLLVPSPFLPNSC
jgi:hypothetical protein